MNVVSMIANLVKERDYCAESLMECRAIIKQLTEGPGEIEYVNPFDVLEILNDPENSWKFESVESVKSGVIVSKTGKKYKQSAFIPAKTKRLSTGISEA